MDNIDAAKELMEYCDAMVNEYEFTRDLQCKGKFNYSGHTEKCDSYNQWASSYEYYGDYLSERLQTSIEDWQSILFKECLQAKWYYSTCKEQLKMYAMIMQVVIEDIYETMVRINEYVWQ